MQALLNNFAQALIANCPFLIVHQFSGSYYKNTDQDLIPEFEEDSTNLPINVGQTGTLTSKRVAVLNGGTIQSLSANHLSGQQNSILKFAVSALAHTFCISSMANANISKKTFTKASFERDLDLLSVYSTEDTRLIVSTLRMQTFRPQASPQIIHWPQSTLICTRSVYDYTYPIVMPSGRYTEMIAFRYNTSFVISDPKFSVTGNALYFEFLYDIQATNRTLVYS